MIKLIIFDLDGVLVDTKKIHYFALNKALEKSGYKPISFEDHSKIYDGLPTSEKLKILLHKKKIDKKKIVKIKKIKDQITSVELKKKIQFSKKIYKMFFTLSKNYKIAIATNAIRKTLNTCLLKLKINKFVDFALSNQDVKNNKPNPEIYLKIFIKFGVCPNESIIIEDSHHGRIAAINSGGILMPVKKIKDVSLKKIQIFINQNITLNKTITNYWEDKSMNVLIPMAGAGKRFADAGFMFPKPLIEIKNKPMIQWVIESLQIRANYIFIVQKEHQLKFNINSVLKILQPNCKIIELDKVTEGAACTTLLAKKFINTNQPLVIANSDQFIKWNSSKSIYDFTNKNIDGAILTFKSIHPKWSYARCDKNNFVLEVAEKKVISDNATVGVYFWKHGKDYVKYAEKMIKKNIRVNNEFYVCPVYNEAIKDKKIIKIQKVDEMWGIGTPEDLQNFNLNFR